MFIGRDANFTKTDLVFTYDTMESVSAPITALNLLPPNRLAYTCNNSLVTC